MKREDYFDRNYIFDEIEVDPRFIRCLKEMKISFAVWILFAVSSIGAAYMFGKSPVGSYSYIMGLPQWWFVVISIAVIFSGLVIYITKFVFQDMSLEDEISAKEKSAVSEAKLSS